MMRIGILPLGRLTFDVPYANEKLSAMLAVLDGSGHDIVGPRELLCDMDMGRAAIEDLQAAGVDQVLILQVTFTDAALTAEVARSFAEPLSIWAVPEPRLGGRLRLNAFCGLNLASHALSLAKRSFGWLYRDAEAVSAASLDALLSGQTATIPLPTTPSKAFASDAGASHVASVKGSRILRIGPHPDGFDTCSYDATALESMAGVSVNAIGLPDLFDTAKAADADDVVALRRQIAPSLTGLDAVDQDQLDRSLRLKLALDKLRRTHHSDAFALRCWPETFTEYGGAICGPAGLMGEAKVPCACEADVYGALTQLVLQDVSGAPVFLADIVDMDEVDNTGVVWHCGQAPLSMIDPEVAAAATIHTNRKMPLLFEFPLKPGPVTLLRVSQAFGTPRLVIAKGEMLKRPMAFTGTSGVLSFSRPVRAVLPDLFNAGLEHHMALAYGDHVATLRAVAAGLDLPILEL